MSERYNSLFSLPDNLYVDGFPFVISAGKLLFDNMNGKVIAQLKIKNLSKKTVSALKISITCYDVAKRVIGDDVIHTYLDLNALANSEFGQKTPIILMSSETRSMDVKFVEAVYSDGAVLTAPDFALLPIQMPESLAVLGNELAEEYRHIHGAACRFIPKKQDNIWICSCGAIVSDEFDACHICGNRYKQLAANGDKTVLTEKRSNRLANEDQARKEGIYQKACSTGDFKEAVSLFSSISDYKDSAQKIEELNRKAEEKRAKSKKRSKILAICGGVAVIAIAVVLLIVFVFIPDSNYSKAIKLMEEGKYEEAIAAFEALGGYKDSDEQILEYKYFNAVALMGEGKYEEAIAAFEVLDGYKNCDEQILECKYLNAVALMGEGKYEEAIAAFEELRGYKDSAEQAKECYYLFALDLKSHKRYGEAISVFEKIGDYKDSDTLVQEIKNYYKIVAIAAGDYHTVGLRANGTAVSIGYDHYGLLDDINYKRPDIVAISAGSDRTIGLRTDGTVFAVGDNIQGRCNVDGWSDIIAVSINGDSAGLKSDGTVVVSGDRLDVKDWRDIVAISSGGYHILGLKANGTVVANHITGNNYNIVFNHGECYVNGWRDIVAISANDGISIGLKSDGTVVAVGCNEDGQCNVSDWTDIIAISAGVHHTVGLKSDGTVVAVGRNKYGQCNVSDWTDIIAISAGVAHTVGLKSDGTVVAVGDNEYGQCNVEELNKIP